jgi:hypothetical protein
MYTNILFAFLIAKVNTNYVYTKILPADATLLFNEAKILLLGNKI